MFDDVLKKVADMRKGFIEAQKELDAAKTEYQRISNEIPSLTNAERNKISYYIVKHDSHANNSLGGQVLGRYMFKYDLKTGKGFGVVKTND